MEAENKNDYLPLFRKYRPQSFKDVIGQEFTVKALENAIKLDKIANAYLFCGPRGTGKTSSARIFAKSLNCKEGPTIDPCQKCQSCLDVTNASGLDVIEIDAATNRGIDDAKELISKVQYAPMNGKYKIFIIDEVHMLSKEAFNALLKTFEEPPKNVIFILATTEPHKVIETIVSRCQRFDFRRITIDDIVKRLREISDLEKINITDEALYAIAKNVSGGMRDSLALLDQASILGIEKEITKETIESLIGKLTFEVLYNLTGEILNEDIEASVQSVENIYEKGSEPRNFVENYIEFLRNIILVISAKNTDIASDLTLISKENADKIKNDSRFSREKLVYFLDKVIDFYKEIKVSTNPYLWAELMVISLASPVVEQKVSKDAAYSVSTPLPNIPKASAPQKETFAPAVETIEAKREETEIKAPEKAEERIYTSSKEKETVIESNSLDSTKENIEAQAKTEPPVQNSKPVTEESAPSVQPAQNEGEPAKIWAEILNKVESIPAKFFYSGVGKLVGIQGGHITLGFVNENALLQAKSDNKYKPLTKAIQAVLGENGGIEFITVDQNTKIIDTKINVKVSSPSQSAPYAAPKAQNNFGQNEEKEHQNNYNSAPFEEKQHSKKEEPDEEKVDTSNYTRVTKEMLEAYSGRVIE